MNRRSSDVLGGRRRGFRVPVARLIAAWTAGAVALPGLAVLAAVEVLTPAAFDAMGLVGLGAVWLLVSAAATALVAWRLSAVLAKPGDTLLAIKRIDGETSPVNRDAIHAAYRGLDELLVRSAHEKNGRISELARARDSARVEGEARADFFAGMSHELRTPLNAIIGYAMLLAEDAAEAGESATARDLDRILQSSRHLLRLINDILDLTRLDAGEVFIDRSVVDVSAMVETIVDGVADEAARSGSAIKVHVAPNARVMLGDGGRLRQCLSAILGNLLETHPGRGISFDVVLADGDDARVEFRLSDLDGRMTAAAATALEVELAQDAGGQPSSLDSAVLAMTVARRLSVLMDGSLITEPASEGDVFVLSLPLSASLGTLGDPAEPAFAQVTAPANDKAASRTVLVIDDDEPTIDLLDRWLSSQGYRVLAATNGVQGLEMARAHSPQFVILDIFMPGQSGYEVLAEMKADPALRNIPVIIASSDDNRKLGLEAGAAEVMVKPLSRQRLHNVLDVLGEQVTGDLLVVDDDPDVREIVQRYAVQAGLSVRLAANGEEGMAMAREQAPGAIILDLCMPDTDGFAMIEALARDSSLSHVPVMVLSQLDISVREHARIQKAGHVFHPKWKSSPTEIVENIKTMVAR
ncbi:MAG: response regulator [Brevundimonas sp.]|nr:MAG: response regulator [Brevundimonas sp.]